MNKKWWAGILIFGAMVFGGVMFDGVVVNEAYADGGGGWIGGGAPGLAGGVGGSTGGGCSWPGSTYLLQCTGFSWVFYESTGDLETEIIFRPDSASNTHESSRNVRIDKACSEHTDKNGGFWHFGSNAQAISGGRVFGYFAGYNYLNSLNGGISNDTYTYTSTNGAWGHMLTYNYGALNAYYWAGSSGQYGGPYTVPTTNGGLDHRIYKDGIMVYKAAKYGTLQEVLSEYKAAYEYINGPNSSNNIQGLPDDLYAFCSWDMDAEPEYYSASNARAGEGSGHLAQTGIKKVETSTTASTLNLKVGDETRLIFSHNIYSDKKAYDTNWGMSRTVSVDGELKNGFWWTGYNEKYSIANEVEGIYQGVTNITTGYVSGDVNYIADERNYVYGNTAFLTRDDYQKVRFKAKGTYEFCETMTVAGKKLTTACLKIVVSEDGQPGPEPEPEPEPENYCEATGWKPGSYDASSERSGETSVLSAVKNESAGFNNWVKSNGVSESAFYSNVVYAKPNDKIDWVHCYYPGAQRVANEMATRENQHPHPPRVSGNYNTLDNIRMRNYAGWANWFEVSNTNLLAMNYYLGNYAIGLDTIRQWEDSYTVESGNRSRAGLSLLETNTASPPKSAWANEGDTSHEWRCNSYKCDPYECGTEEHPRTCWKTCWERCWHRNPFYENGRNMAKAVDKVMVKVPYNFVNSVTVALNNKDNIVYAGETAKVGGAQVKVGTRYNQTTKGTYATKVDSSEVRLIAYTSNSSTGTAVAGYGNYTSDLCGMLPVTHGNCTIDDYDGAGRGGTLNKNEDYRNGKTETKFSNASYNVYDVSAGEYFCVVAAVYPYTVSGNTDVKDANNRTPWVTDGSKYSWYVSAPSCNIIAKRPNLQVWGGSLYSAGKIATSYAEKNNIYGYYGYSATSKASTTVFGSWVEHSILAPSSPVSGLASGAATAGYGTTSRTPREGLGGSLERNVPNFCVRSPLTMPNSSCSTQVSGGYASVKAGVPSDKLALIERFTDSEHIGYEYDNSTTGLGDTLVPRGKTWVIHRNDDFAINGNIIYEDNYSSIAEVPKLIIYANNIKIACNVERVDAVLIAENEVQTCYDSNNVNSRANSRQLKINGTVITDTFNLQRTYGAAKGIDSIVPAEIVDYDTSLYIWGAPRSDAAASGKLLTVYQRELSPRY